MMEIGLSYCGTDGQIPQGGAADPAHQAFAAPRATPAFSPSRGLRRTSKSDARDFAPRKQASHWSTRSLRS